MRYKVTRDFRNETSKTDRYGILKETLKGDWYDSGEYRLDERKWRKPIFPKERLDERKSRRELDRIARENDNPNRIRNKLYKNSRERLEKKLAKR